MTFIYNFCMNFWLGKAIFTPRQTKINIVTLCYRAYGAWQLGNSLIKALICHSKYSPIKLEQKTQKRKQAKKRKALRFGLILVSCIAGVRKKSGKNRFQLIATTPRAIVRQVFPARFYAIYSHCVAQIAEGCKLVEILTRLGSTKKLYNRVDSLPCLLFSFYTTLSAWSLN